MLGSYPACYHGNATACPPAPRPPAPTDLPARAVRVEGHVLCVAAPSSVQPVGALHLQSLRDEVARVCRSPDKRRKPGPSFDSACSSAAPGGAQALPTVTMSELHQRKAASLPMVRQSGAAFLALCAVLQGRGQATWNHSASTEVATAPQAACPPGLQRGCRRPPSCPDHRRSPRPPRRRAQEHAHSGSTAAILPEIERQERRLDEVKRAT